MLYGDEDDEESINDTVQTNVDIELYLLVLGYDHLRMLAVWHAVPMVAENAGRPDLFRWSVLADVPIERVKALYPALRDLGCLLPDGKVPTAVRGVLIKKVKEMVEGE